MVAARRASLSSDNFYLHLQINDSYTLSTIKAAAIGMCFFDELVVIKTDVKKKYRDIYISADGFNDLQMDAPWF